MISSMKQTDKWIFSEIPSIEESTFNKVLEKFYDLGIQGLTKENIQNSLDGKLPESQKPVIVKIQLGQIRKSEIPGIEEVEKRIQVLEGQNSYSKDIISNMQRKMRAYREDSMIDYISFEDLNTKGLTGAKNGQSNNKADTWGIYAYNKGVHSEEENADAEKARGGSHGLGKIASNAASELHMMYFANCDAEGNQHLGGTVQLIEHKYERKYYRSTGYFTKQKIEGGYAKFYPFENEFGPVFSKNTRGLKIIIPFLREGFSDEKALIKTICDNFFYAVDEKRLVVYVNGKEINDETLPKYIYNPEYYEQDYQNIKTEFTPLYYRTYKEAKETEIEIQDRRKIHRFRLFFQYNDQIVKGRAAVVRTIGMKIEDKKIKNNATKPFNAVLIPCSIAEDEFLKSLENESHTELASEHIRETNDKKNAERFINNISTKMAEVINQAIRERNPVDGKIDTKDILYVMNGDFQKELAATSEKVVLQSSSTQLVKRTSDTQKRKKKKSKTKTGGGKTREKTTTIPSRKKEFTVPGADGTEEKKIRYGTFTDMVERIVLGSKEILQFDFSAMKEVANATHCNISIAVVDGMGNEYDHEFDIKHSYISVVDKATNTKCELSENSIKGVQIMNGVSKLELTLASSFNKSLKFIYYVEV